MRKLSLLLLALAIACFAQNLIASAENFAPYVLRDGLLLSAIALLLFAGNALPWPLSAKPTATSGESGSTLPAILIGTGLICAFAGGLWTTFGATTDALHIAGLILWGLGIVLLLIGSWWPGATVQYNPPAYRWQVDAAGKYVRMALGEQGEAAQPANNAVAFSLGWLLLLLALAAFFRLWQLTTLPADCIDVECGRALALLKGNAEPSWYTTVAHTFLTWTGDSLLSLRLTSALLGIATIPAFYLAALELIGAGGALLTTLLLAFSPWHIWSSRSSEVWIVLPLLLCLALWGILRAQRTADRRFWIIAGLSLGLVIMQLPTQQLAVWVWLILIVLVATIQRPKSKFQNLLFPFATLAIALPLLVKIIQTSTLWPPMAGSWGSNLLDLLTHLLRQSAGNAVTIFMDRPLLDTLSAALIIVGFGYLLRSLRHFAAIVVISGFTLFGITILRTDLTKFAPATLLLTLLPFFLLSAAAALGCILAALQQTWRPLLRPVRMAAIVIVLLLLLGGRNAFSFTRHLRSLTTAGPNSTETAMGRFLAQQLRAAPPDLTIFAPSAVLNNPTTRLLAGSILDNAQVRPLESALDFVLSGTVQGNLLYLIPLANQDLLHLLQQLYPDSTLQPQKVENSDQPLFLTFQTPAKTVADTQGLLAFVFNGNEGGDVSKATSISAAGPLQFDWQAQKTLTKPFSVQWQGSLLVPAAGDYTFSAEMNATNGALFSLRLDNQVVLDTSLNVTSKPQTLAKGFYRLDMLYRSGVAPSVQPPAPLTVRWQRPGSGPEVIQANVLHRPALPNLGLLGTYYAGNQWQGPALDIRKDLVIGQPVNLPAPYSVRWQGKLATPRTGEYMLATLGAGVNQVAIDNQVLIDNQQVTVAAEKADPNYTEGIIYLNQGWHTIEIRHIPGENNAGLKLLWQPPGSNPEALTSDYLAPVVADVAPGDLPLPAAPPLVDARFGNESFALSQAIDLWKPQVRLPPANLPPLRFEQLWQTGNACGSGPDQLNQPHGVAIDPNGKLLYVADTGNRRVRQFHWDGTGGALIQNDQFQEPFDIEMNRDGSPLLLDAVAQQIFHIEPNTGNAQILPRQTGFYRPRGFTIDQAGNFAVADTGGGRVVILSSAGQVLAEFGKQGSTIAKGQPVDVLAGNGALWAITAEDGRLWQLDTLGSLTALPRGDTLNGPHLAGLPNGSFFLSDPSRKTVLYFAPTGQPLAQFVYQDSFAVPTGIAAAQVDNFVYLAVSDSQACTLSLWRIQGNALGQ
ncbi:MAG: PA14 domain-containing protein [Caldilineaceae bacterium]